MSSVESEAEVGAAMASTVRRAQATSPSRLATPPDGSTHEATVEGRTGAAVTGQGTGQGVHWRDRTAPSATVDRRQRETAFPGGPCERHRPAVPANRRQADNRAGVR